MPSLVFGALKATDKLLYTYGSTSIWMANRLLRLFGRINTIEEDVSKAIDTTKKVILGVTALSAVAVFGYRFYKSYARDNKIVKYEPKPISVAAS